MGLYRGYRPVYRGYRLYRLYRLYTGIYGVQAYIQGRPVYGIYRCTGYIPLYRLCRLYRPIYRLCRVYTGYRPIYRCTGLYTAMQAIPAIQAIRPRLHTPYIPCTGLCTLYGVYRAVHRGIYRDRPSTLDPRRILDKPANPRTNDRFVSARGRMRAPAGAHYARARVYRRPHARARYVGPNP